jgi:hypothetical protein
VQLGCVIGHIYYYGQDLWPKEMMSGGKKWFETPHLL